MGQFAHHDNRGNYGSINDHDLEEPGMNDKSNNDDGNFDGAKHSRNSRVVMACLSAFLLIVGILSFYHHSEKEINPFSEHANLFTSMPSPSKSNAVDIKDATLPVVEEEEEQEEVPFPHVDRFEYGTNAAAETIVDPSLFAPSLLANDDNSSALLKVPFPTGAFWTNLVIKPTADQLLSYPVMSYPYGYKWNPNMVQVSFPSLRRLMDHLSVRDIFNPDLTLKTVEDVTARHITYFDPLSVTLRFESEQMGGGGLWETYLVQGSPYITARYEDMTPVIQPLSIFKGISCIETKESDNGDLCKEIHPAKATSPPDKFIMLEGTHFLITTRENLSWMVFTSDPVTLVFDNIRKTTVSTQDAFTGVLRLALIPPPLEETLDYTSQFPQFYDGILPDGETTLSSSSGVRKLMDHASVYPTGANVSWTFPSEDTGNVQFQYNTKSMTTTSNNGGAELLMLALPHHTDVLLNASSSNDNNACTLLDDYNEFDLLYRTIKGHMTPVLGAVWSFDETLTSIEFDGDTALENADKLDETTRGIILDQVAADVSRVLPTLDENVYGYGKQVARLAQLVHIAHVLTSSTNSNSTYSSKYSTLIEDSMETLHHFVAAFLSGKNTDILVYDINFGGLVTRDGLKDFMGDFGNGWYNDHHFHYGYHLYACALLGRWNSTFVSEYGSKVDAMMFDVVHNSYASSDELHTGENTAFFPLARHKSWFDGHSFASGLFPFASGKSMESSSESVNCYYGAYLWSTVRGKPGRLNFARLLLAMEIRAVKTYWHMSPKSTGDANADAKLYNPTFAKNLMVGNLGMMDVTVSTWFGSNPLYVHMINFMPVTAITHELFDTSYLESEYEKVIKPIYDNVEMAWKGYVVCDRAMLNPNAAWNDALELRSYELDQAISQSQVLYFISTTDGFEAQEPKKGTEEFPEDEKNTASDSALGSDSCLNNKGCADLGLTGLCCPTAEGTNLGCCGSLPESTNAGKSALPPNKDTTVPKSDELDTASCSAHQGCVALNLVGLCCPTSGGVNLSCCEG